MGGKTNRILILFFAGVFFLNFFHLLLGFLSIPRYYERVTTLTIPADNLPGAIYPTNETVQQGAAAHGMTLSQYAVEQVVFHSALVLLFMTVAGVLVARAKGNWFTWYSASFLVFIAGFTFFDERYVARLLPLWIDNAGALFWPFILLYFFLFPNGKPAPRRSLWVIGPVLILHFIFQLSGSLLLLIPNAPAQSTLEAIQGPGETLIVSAFFFIFGCQVYRYIRISTREEKLQTKWFLLGFIFFLVLSTANEALGTRNPFREEIDLLIFAFVPLSVGVAVMRYRLWDIDVLIRKTLVYSVLTGVLALVYFGGVVLVGELTRSITGEISNIAVVVSTLSIAALFVPLRRRVQATIDRRFYRRTHNAAQNIAAFGASVQNEVDMEKLTGELLSLVNETMQPVSVSLWLKDR